MSGQPEPSPESGLGGSSRSSFHDGESIAGPTVAEAAPAHVHVSPPATTSQPAKHKTHRRNPKIFHMCGIGYIALFVLGMVLAITGIVLAATDTDIEVATGRLSYLIILFGIAFAGYPLLRVISHLFFLLVERASKLRVAATLIAFIEGFERYLPALLWAIIMSISQHELLLLLDESAHHVINIFLFFIGAVAVCRSLNVAVAELVVMFLARPTNSQLKQVTLAKLDALSRVYKLAEPNFDVDIAQVTRQKEVRSKFKSAARRALLMQRLSVLKATGEAKPVEQEAAASPAAAATYADQAAQDKPNDAELRHHAGLDTPMLKAFVVLLEYSDKRVEAANTIFEFVRARTSRYWHKHHKRQQTSIEVAENIGTLEDLVGHTLHNRAGFQMEMHRVHRLWTKLHLPHPDVGVLSNTIIAVLRLVIAGIGGMAFVTFVSNNAIAVLVPLASVFLGLSFMLSSTAQMVAESLVFVLVRQPFDVGDLVFLGSDPNVYRVDNVSVLSSTFLDLLNHKSSIPNQKLAKMQIKNLHRSPHGVVLVELWIGAKTTKFQYSQLKKAIVQLVRSDPEVWRPLPAPRTKITNCATDSSKKRLWIYIDTTFGPQQLGPMNAARSTAYLYVTDTLRKLDVDYEMAPTTTTLHGDQLADRLGAAIGTTIGEALILSTRRMKKTKSHSSPSRPPALPASGTPANGSAPRRRRDRTPSSGHGSGSGSGSGIARRNSDADVTEVEEVVDLDDSHLHVN